MAEEPTATRGDGHERELFPAPPSGRTRGDLTDIDGVFFAVKCVVCETVYAAESDEYLAFWGSVTVGLEQPLIGVAAPRKPAKRAIAVVCRDPRCIATTVRKMLGADGSRGNAEALWAQALKIWSQEAGHALVESAAPAATAPSAPTAATTTAATTTAPSPAPAAAPAREAASQPGLLETAPAPAPAPSGSKKRA